MIGLRKYWLMLGCVLAGTSMACLALTRSEIPSPHNTGPWLFGPSKARWTVTEFADLECPYCKTYTPALKTWIQQQKDVNLQWHHLPLDVHGPTALHEAKLAECAGALGGAPAFWQAIDQIFDRTRSNGEGFNGHLNVVDVTYQDLLSCAATDKVIARHVGQQVEEALKAGITATPTVIIKDNTTGSSVLNDLIETSIDGQKGFKECADDIKHPELKALFAKRSADCATAAAELKTAVRALGGDPEQSGSVAGALHRGWVDVKSMVTGKDEEAVLNEAERGEDHALKA